MLHVVLEIMLVFSFEAFFDPAVGFSHGFVQQLPQIGYLYLFRNVHFFLQFKQGTLSLAQQVLGVQSELLYGLEPGAQRHVAHVLDVWLLALELEHGQQVVLLGQIRVIRKYVLLDSILAHHVYKLRKILKSFHFLYCFFLNLLFFISKLSFLYVCMFNGS